MTVFTQTPGAGTGGQRNLTDEAARWVREYFHKTAGAACFFHNYQHTWDTVVAGRKIARGMQVGERELEILTIACWFHDIAWFPYYIDHEVRSAETAAAFLRRQQVEQDRIEAVRNCILATRYPPRPVTLLEKIICDADVSHLGMKNYYEKNLLLRQELEVNMGKTYSDAEWLTMNRDFFLQHRYFTSYARRLYGRRKQKNLETILELLAGDEVVSPDCGGIGWM
ncbi:MAG: HD domain-containing protein [Deltaproteobacteria bacterium]|nr:HD domain-containing protein [Deltaproteobacteria bacterium]